MKHVGLLDVQTNIRLSGFHGPPFSFLTGKHKARGDRAVLRRKERANLKSVGKSVSQFHRALSMRWRIRIDFQEGKFMFENWKDAYAVLFTTRIRKNGSSGRL